MAAGMHGARRRLWLAMLVASAILALMLAVGPLPGRSLYSVVAVAQGSPAPCGANERRCRKPWRDIRTGRWLRYESESEGLARYQTIATAIAAESHGDAWIALLMIAIIRHESAWRRDVHSGYGRWARGDHGRSWCLGQILLDRHGRRRDASGASGLDMVGIDLPATSQCMAAISGRLVRAVAACRKAGRRGPRCPLSAYGGLGAHSMDPRINARVDTLRTLAQMTHKP